MEVTIPSVGSPAGALRALTGAPTDRGGKDAGKDKGTGKDGHFQMYRKI
jgi:hypothetical protein